MDHFFLVKMSLANLVFLTLSTQSDLTLRPAIGSNPLPSLSHPLLRRRFRGGPAHPALLPLPFSKRALRTHGSQKGIRDNIAMTSLSERYSKWESVNLTICRIESCTIDRLPNNALPYFSVYSAISSSRMTRAIAILTLTKIAGFG